MTDARAQAWLLAQDCLTNADKVLEDYKPTLAEDAEIPLVAQLYLKRAQILATLASAPYDVMIAVCREAEDREKFKAKARKHFEDHMQRTPIPDDGVTP